jgi:hypothetical protein
MAALVGTVGGSFLAASVAIYTVGPAPLLAGGASIFVGSLLGALVGAAGGALPAFVLGRAGWPRGGAFLGAIVGIGTGGAMGFLSEGTAQAWVNAFSGNALAGALVGGGIAGALVGIAVASSLRVLRRSGTPVKRAVQFAGLVGSLAGAFAGIGGAGIGASLAQAASVCPNGYFGNPYTPSGCVPGLLQGALLIGIWIGALMGAIGAMATAEVLGLLPAPADSEPRAP